MPSAKHPFYRQAEHFANDPTETPSSDSKTRSCPRGPSVKSIFHDGEEYRGAINLAGTPAPIQAVRDQSALTRYKTTPCGGTTASMSPLDFFVSPVHRLSVE